MRCGNCPYQKEQLCDFPWVGNQIDHAIYVKQIVGGCGKENIVDKKNGYVEPATLTLDQKQRIWCEIERRYKSIKDRDVIGFQYEAMVQDLFDKFGGRDAVLKLALEVGAGVSVNHAAGAFNVALKWSETKPSQHSQPRIGAKSEM